MQSLLGFGHGASCIFYFGASICNHLRCGAVCSGDNDTVDSPRLVLPHHLRLAGEGSWSWIALMWNDSSSGVHTRRSFFHDVSVCMADFHHNHCPCLTHPFKQTSTSSSSIYFTKLVMHFLCSLLVRCLISIWVFL